MRDSWKTTIAIVIVVALILSAAPFQPIIANESVPNATMSESIGDKLEQEAVDSWIIRWDGEIDPQFAEQSIITDEQDFLNVTVAKPRDGIDPDEWFKRWQSSPYVRYIQPNHKVQAAAVANDTSRGLQRYLDMINVNAAWDHVTANTAITIAVVDTGVDLNHPDLRANLVAGYNFKDNNDNPQDDNGHGTNVAGVIAAVGNNRLGTSGILWNAKIMPIKALDKKGSGEEETLGKAIKYAVDNGAKIVVMSLGLHRYSPYLEDVVKYAEQHGVLLVAAAGNEGNDIKYPAAYKTVLAVGGIGSNGSIVQESNYGPELDLVAPWEVYTTALDGKYQSNYGTSMAAPQVAAVAAMVFALHPDWTPAQVRNHLRATAEDLSVRKWDERTGYGLLRADRAVTTPYSADIYEPNNSRVTAAELPIDHIVYGELSRSDIDWFYVQAPYKGKLNVELTRMSGASDMQVTLEHYDINGNLLGSYPNMLGKSMTLNVTTARSYIRLVPTGSNANATMQYALSASFTIYSDEYEDNDRQYKAYRLQARSQVLTGTFHQQDDYDWFQIPITQNGTLRVKVTVDTMRIDPYLMIQRQGGMPIEVDSGSEGKMEYSDAIDVTPGTYYLLIKNIISTTTYPVTGEYTVTIEYSPKYIDPNEPNDRAYQAVMMVPGTVYNGVISSNSDQDWFTFKMDAEAVAEFDLTRIPKDRTMTITIYDSAQKMLAAHTSKLGSEQLNVRMALSKGMYYVRLTANSSFQDQMYGLTVHVRELIGGFIDIQNNWAKDAILSLVQQGIVEGYGDYTFRPNAPLMRSEAVTMIVRAFNLEQQRNVTYKDVPIRHWAYQSILRASTAGIVQGYPDGTFRPDNYVTRVEMAQMLGNAMKLSPLNENPGFKDISADYWAAGMLAALKRNRILTGYPDGTFRPNETATRAEFANLLYKAIQ